MRTKQVARGLALAAAGAVCGAAAGWVVGLPFGVLLLAAGGKIGAVLSASLFWAVTGALTGAIMGAVGSLDEAGFVADVSALWLGAAGRGPKGGGSPPTRPPRKPSARVRSGRLARSRRLR
jgi:hypothetical protein